MVEASHSLPPTKPETPKRKYTVSDKVRAANRLNLAQANANPAKKYLHTSKRPASTYSNCLKAREAKRQKRLRGQATRVKYGLAVVNLFATLGLADASREELSGHLGFFRSAFRPRSNNEDKVAKAFAHCAWRRSQVLQVHAVDETLLMKARLIRASDPALGWLAELPTQDEGIILRSGRRFLLTRELVVCIISQMASCRCTGRRTGTKHCPKARHAGGEDNRRWRI